MTIDHEQNVLQTRRRQSFDAKAERTKSAQRSGSAGSMKKSRCAPLSPVLDLAPSLCGHLGGRHRLPKPRIDAQQHCWACSFSSAARTKSYIRTGGHKTPGGAVNQK